MPLNNSASVGQAYRLQTHTSMKNFTRLIALPVFFINAALALAQDPMSIVGRKYEHEMKCADALRFMSALGVPYVWNYPKPDDEDVNFQPFMIIHDAKRKSLLGKIVGKSSKGIYILNADGSVFINSKSSLKKREPISIGLPFGSNKSAKWFNVNFQKSNSSILAGIGFGGRSVPTEEEKNQGNVIEYKQSDLMIGDRQMERSLREAFIAGIQKIAPHYKYPENRGWISREKVENAKPACSKIPGLDKLLDQALTDIDQIDQSEKTPQSKVSLTDGATSQEQASSTASQAIE